MNRLQVRAWRQTRSLTQSQLGELLGLNKMAVYRWESGETNVPPFLHLALERLDQVHTWSPAGVDVLPVGLRLA